MEENEVGSLLLCQIQGLVTDTLSIMETSLWKLEEKTEGCKVLRTSFCLTCHNLDGRYARVMFLALPIKQIFSLETQPREEKLCKYFCQLTRTDFLPPSRSRSRSRSSRSFSTLICGEDSASYLHREDLEMQISSFSPRP